MSVAARWRGARLLDAPHRWCFFWGGINWAAAASWWAAQMVCAALGAAWPWCVPAAAAHGLWFGFGAMPLFIAGFMFTAGPRWLQRPAVDARQLRWPVGVFMLGWLVAAAGFHLGAALAAAGLALVALGWGGLTWRIVRLVWGSAPEVDRRHPRLIALACVLIVLGLAASSLLLASERVALLPTTLRVTLWGGVVTVFLVASHRLLPFLGEGAWPALDARWPAWPLWVVLSVPPMQIAAALMALWPAAWTGWRSVQAAHLAATATVCLWIALRWIRARALRQPLVAMLFGAFLWWDAALWLQVAACWADAGSTASMAADLAALHALTMGFLGGTLLVMVTRVSSTHDGRPQAIDGVARALYLALQAAVLLRLAAALHAATAAWWLPAAALAWTGVALVWAARHGRWLGLSRIDGRPG